MRRLQKRYLYIIGICAFLICIGLLFTVLKKQFWQQDSLILLQKDIWDRVRLEHDHELLKREQQLTARPVRQHTIDTYLDIDLTAPLTGSENELLAPTFSGMLHMSGLVQMDINQQKGQGRLVLQGTFSGPVLSVLSGTLLSGTLLEEEQEQSQTNPFQVNLDAQVDLLRSGNQHRYHLDTLQLTQSGQQNTFLLIAWAYLKELEQTWISHEDAPGWVRDLIEGNVFSSLSKQTDQHFITTLSGEQQLLISGPTLGVDVQRDQQALLDIILKFPQAGVRVLMNEHEDRYYELHTTHYRLDRPLMSGTIQFTPLRRELVSDMSRTGGLKNGLNRSGSNISTITPLPMFSITPPQQTRRRSSIVSGWKNAY